MEGKQWEGQIVDGRFPLHRYLGGCAPTAVFLTECRKPKPRKAAIKLVPAGSVDERVLFTRWRLAANLSHPHLLLLFQAGQCRLNGIELLYVVTEYADDDLSQVLPHRPLTETEARELLAPAVDALAYLHGKGFVHGHLKPANILAVGDQLKLSSDGICRVGEPWSGSRSPGPYDPPEVSVAGASSAGDVWSFAVTLVEALTQRLPFWRPQEEEVVLPETLPAPFGAIALHCLRREPESRWTVADIAACAQGQKPARRRRRLFQWRYALPVAALGVALAAVLAGPNLLRRDSQLPSATPLPSEQPKTQSAPPVEPPPSGTQLETRPDRQVPGKVVQQVLPEVPQEARDTIQGRVRVGVRVVVDPSGRVADASLDSPGPSRYFARLALEAARRWKFEPARVGDRGVSSEWRLRFVFENDGTRVLPVRSAP